MSTYKTKLEIPKAEEFINTYFKTKGVKLEMVSGGENSQAYFFRVSGKDYVLRVSSNGKEGYIKDNIAYENFSSEGVPIPRVLEIGEIEKGLSFIITERAPGKILGDFTPDVTSKLTPKIIDVLFNIHKIVPLGSGFGPWGLDGNGKFKTWKDYLIASIRQDTYPSDGAEFFDEEFQEKLKNEIRELIAYCPEERHLLHEDFGTGNAISDGKEITAVIDWEDSIYGDPLKDIARLDFWAEGHGFVDAFKEHYRQSGGIPDNFDERILCYKLHCGLSALWFMAYSGQKQSYNTVMRIVNRIKR